MGPAYRRAGEHPGSVRQSAPGSPQPVVAAPEPLCHRVCVDQEGPDPDFSATGSVSGGRLTVHVSGEVDMSTADEMFEAAIQDDAKSATLDLTRVTFFDSA